MRPQIIRPVGMQRMPLFGSGGGGGIGFPPMPPPPPFGHFPPSQMRLPPFLSAHGGLPPPPPPPPPLHHPHHPQSMQTSYDPYLPCNSVHFYNSFQNLPSNASRRRHPAGEQQQPPGQYHNCCLSCSFNLPFYHFISLLLRHNGVFLSFKYLKCL